MLMVSARQLAELAAVRRAGREVDWVVDTLRAAYTDAVSMFESALLRREGEACLQRCDAIGLKTDGDRLGLCMLDIILMPGVRELPELPVIAPRCIGPQGARRQGDLFGHVLLRRHARHRQRRAGFEAGVRQRGARGRRQTARKQEPLQVRVAWHMLSDPVPEPFMHRDSSGANTIEPSRYWQGRAWDVEGHVPGKGLVRRPDLTIVDDPCIFQAGDMPQIAHHAGPGAAGLRGGGAGPEGAALALHQPNLRSAARLRSATRVDPADHFSQRWLARFAGG